jgi:hypothetical protein
MHGAGSLASRDRATRLAHAVMHGDGESREKTGRPRSPSTKSRGIFRHIPTRAVNGTTRRRGSCFLYEKDAYTVRGRRSWRHNKGRRARGDVAAAAVLDYWITYLYKFVLLRDCLVGIRTPLRCACRDVDSCRRRRRARRPPCRLQ